MLECQTHNLILWKLLCVVTVQHPSASAHLATAAGAQQQLVPSQETSATMMALKVVLPEPEFDELSRTASTFTRMQARPFPRAIPLSNGCMVR